MSAWGKLKTWISGAVRSLTVWTSLLLIAAPDALAYMLSNWPQLAPFIPAAMQSRVMNVIGLLMFVLRIKTVQSLAQKGAVAAGIVIAVMTYMALAGCGSAGTASAAGNQDVLSWVNPTQRTDSTPFTTQSDTLIMWGRSGGPYSDGSQAVAFPLATVVIPAVYTGTRCYVAIARDTPVTDPVTKAVTQAVSASSVEACRTIVALPNAPTGLGVK